MQQIKSLKQAWIFDSKGQLKQSKNQSSKNRANQIYNIAKEALFYVANTNNNQTLKRISFVNGNQQWTITLTDTKEIIVMHKQE